MINFPDFWFLMSEKKEKRKEKAPGGRRQAFFGFL